MWVLSVPQTRNNKRRSWTRAEGQNWRNEVGDLPFMQAGCWSNVLAEPRCPSRPKPCVDPAAAGQLEGEEGGQL
jgi:hypothetical protein